MPDSIDFSCLIPVTVFLILVLLLYCILISTSFFIVVTVTITIITYFLVFVLILFLQGANRRLGGDTLSDIMLARLARLFWPSLLLLT